MDTRKSSSSAAETAAAAEVLASAEAKAKGVFCEVFDMNQRGDLPRSHDVVTKLERNEANEIIHVEVVSYPLYRAKPCKIPLEHAFKFLVDGAFVVKGPNGNRIMPVAKHDESRPLASLRDDEIVCGIAELSAEALLRRVKVLPGSEEIAANATHEELVEWLTKWKKSLKAAGAGAIEFAERLKAAGFDGLDPSMVEKLLPRSTLVDRVAA